MALNKVMLIGNVGKDPQIRYVEGKPVAELTLATTDRAFTTAQGVQVPEKTEWHRLVMWNKLAEFAEKYIRTGAKLYVEGKLRTRTWQDQNAIKHSVTEIYVENLEFLGQSQKQQG